MDREAQNREHAAGGSFGGLVDEISGLHKDLLACQAQMERHFTRIDHCFDRIEDRLDNIDGLLGCIDKGLDRLRTDIPKIVGDAMREVLREERNNW